MIPWKHKIAEFVGSWASGVARGKLTELLNRLVIDVESVDAKLDRLLDAPLKTGLTYLKSSSFYRDRSSEQLENLKEAKRYFIEATSQSTGLKKAQAHYLVGRVSEVLGDMPSRNFHYNQTLQLLYEHKQEFEAVVEEHYRASGSASAGANFGTGLAMFFPAFGLGFAISSGLVGAHSSFFGSGKRAEKMQIEQQKYTDQSMIETITRYEQDYLSNQLVPEKQGFWFFKRSR